MLPTSIYLYTLTYPPFGRLQKRLSRHYYNTAAFPKEINDVLLLLTKGMKGYEIAKVLGVDASTVSRDIQYLISQSHNYLNSLAKETLPFMYQTSIEGIRNVLKECWNIYTM